MKSQLLQMQVLREMANKNQGLKLSRLARGEGKFCSKGKEQALSLGFLQEGCACQATYRTATDQHRFASLGFVLPVCTPLLATAEGILVSTSACIHAFLQLELASGHLKAKLGAPIQPLCEPKQTYPQANILPLWQTTACCQRRVAGPCCMLHPAPWMVEAF